MELKDKKTGATIGFFGDNSVGWADAARALKAHEDKHGKGSVDGYRVDELRRFDAGHRITK